MASHLWVLRGFVVPQVSKVGYVLAMLWLLDIALTSLLAESPASGARA